MAAIITLTTALTVSDTTTTLIAALFNCSRTSFALPYKLIAALSDSDETANQIGFMVLNGATINLDSFMAADDGITKDQDYLAARYRENPDLVRIDKKTGKYAARQTTPAAFVRRFVVPAIEPLIDGAILDALDLDADKLTPSHVANICKTIARTSVDAKIVHYTKGTTTADKAAYNVRKLSRKERKRAARESAAKSA